MLSDKEEYGDRFIRDFLKLFDSYSFNNPVYGRLILHVLLGQALKHIYFRIKARKIDIRISGLLLRPSGAGKGAGYGFFCDFASDLGIDNQKLTEATDAGLAGSAGFYDEKTGIQHVNHGLMEDADMVSMEEANTLFDYNSAFSKKNLTYLQIAMNPLHDASCEISKKLGSMPDAIRFRPHCSFLLLTYMPDQYVDALVKRGVIQRLLTVKQDVSLEERFGAVDVGIDSINISTAEKYKSDYESVLNRLKIVIQKCKGSEFDEYDPLQAEHKLDVGNFNKIVDKLVTGKLTKRKKDEIVKSVKSKLRHFEDKEWYTKYGQEFGFTDPARKALKQAVTELRDKIKDATPKAQEKLGEFVHRMMEMMVRLAIHHAIIRLDNTVRIEDIIYAKKLYTPIWYQTIYFIEEAIVPSTQERLSLNHIIDCSVTAYKSMLIENKHIKQKVWARRPTLQQKVQIKMDNCSAVTADKRLKRIETDNVDNFSINKWFEVKKIGNVQYVRLLQEVR